MSAAAISADGQAIALACSSLALEGDRSLKPLTPTDWNKLSVTLRSADLRPRDLIGLDSDKLREALGLAEEPADRLAALLSRGGQLALEVERLASRGIWIVTRPDDTYPSRLRELLGQQAPPLLFGAGQQAALRTPGIAVVGSRDVDEEGIEFATALGRLCAKQSYAAVSGAARGVDLAAMSGAIVSGGTAVGVTVDPLERLVSRGALRAAIADEQLTLVTPYHPAARWHAGNAMRRNRLIYALAQAAVVVASSAEKGGTRSGALEDLKARWVPLHVRDDGSAGNRRLISEGGIALPTGDLDGLELEKLTRDRQDSLLSTGDRSQGDDTDGAPVGDSGESVPGEAEAAVEDAFVAIWPILAPYLRVPLGERDVAERLRLEPTQARAWLKRAVEEGYAEVKPRPKRYVLRDAAAEQLRIDGA